LAFFSFLKQFYLLDDTAQTINDEAGIDYIGWKRCIRLGISMPGIIHIIRPGINARIKGQKSLKQA
jgi:hypothetical protein